MHERRTTRRRAGDEGFTLIEVVVALLVFAILSSGIVAASSTIIQMTTDNRSRITAANLATQDLDVVRAIADPFSITSTNGSTSIDGRTYYLTRSVSWISASGADASCNSSTNLYFLRVNVRVSWDGMLGTTPAVQDDTILAPSTGTTNSATGAISISVIGAAAQAIAGVSVTVTPESGQPALTAQPKNTTADGCTYANEVAPGKYSVSVTRTGYRSDQELSAPSQEITVSAGATTSVKFSYDQAATFTTNYVAGPSTPSGSLRLPTNLPTTFLNTGVSYTASAPASAALLYPYPSGYSVVAGPGPTSSGTNACASVDPQAWSAGLVNGVQLAGGVRASGAAAAGGSTTLTVPLGVVRVRATAGAAITATQATAQGIGNPGCALTATVLRWSQTASGGVDSLLLPYGSWTILANGSPVSAADLQVATNVAQPGVSLDGTVTLDPRKAR